MLLKVRLTPIPLEEVKLVWVESRAGDAVVYDTRLGEGCVGHARVEVGESLGVLGFCEHLSGARDNAGQLGSGGRNRNTGRTIP